MTNWHQSSDNLVREKAASSLNLNSSRVVRNEGLDDLVAMARSLMADAWDMAASGGPNLSTADQFDPLLVCARLAGIGWRRPYYGRPRRAACRVFHPLPLYSDAPPAPTYVVAPDRTTAFCRNKMWHALNWRG